MANIDERDFAEFLGDLFDTSKADHEGRKISDASQKKIDAILGYIRDNDLWVGSVEVIGARVAIETVEVYGLEITVDANGNAVHVSSPHGFHTDAA